MTPGPEGLHRGLLYLVSNFGKELQFRAAPEVEKLFRALSDMEYPISTYNISQFLSITSGTMYHFPDGIVPCALPQAAMILSCFPSLSLRPLIVPDGFRPALRLT